MPHIDRATDLLVAVCYGPTHARLGQHSAWYFPRTRHVVHVCHREYARGNVAECRCNGSTGD